MPKPPKFLFKGAAGAALAQAAYKVANELYQNEQLRNEISNLTKTSVTRMRSRVQESLPRRGEPSQRMSVSAGRLKSLITRRGRLERGIDELRSIVRELQADVGPNAGISLESADVELRRMRQRLAVADGLGKVERAQEFDNVGAAVDQIRGALLELLSGRSTDSIGRG